MKMIYSNYFITKNEDMFYEWMHEHLSQHVSIHQKKGMVKLVCDDFSIDDFDNEAIELLQQLLIEEAVVCLSELKSDDESMEARCLIISKYSYKIIDFEDYILETVQKEFSEYQYDLDMADQIVFIERLNKLLDEFWDKYEE